MKSSNSGLSGSIEKPPPPMATTIRSVMVLPSLRRDAEPDVLVAVRRRVLEVAIRRSCDELVAAPPAALLDLDLAGGRPGRVGGRTRLVVVRIPPVGDPFQGVAGHVERADPARA